ncbi:MAG TPA: PIN domain-containing protein [Gemmatimonadota bacterium]|nr:PIN domain-containing protein [Gemmatimonadota bacterium]
MNVGLVVDTSVWIDFFGGKTIPLLEDALAIGTVVLPPVVVAELVSGARRPSDHDALLDLMADLEIHETPREHWVRVGELRRHLIEKGLAISTPDAHVTQCALDRDAPLLTADRAFLRIVRHVPLRLVESP